MIIAPPVNDSNSNESKINKDIPEEEQFKLENGIYYCQGIGCLYRAK